MTEALTFTQGADRGRYIAVTEDLTYLVVRRGGKWWLHIYNTESLRDVERAEPHDTRKLAYAVASAYAARAWGYVPAEHGGKNLLTLATLIAYES